jgi:hypothetical protein
MGWDGVEWMHLAQNRDQWRALVNTEMNLRVPWKAGNFLTRIATVSFSRRTLLHGVSYFAITWHTKMACMINLSVNTWKMFINENGHSFVQTSVELRVARWKQVQSLGFEHLPDYLCRTVWSLSSSAIPLFPSLQYYSLSDDNNATCLSHQCGAANRQVKWFCPCCSR